MSADTRTVFERMTAILADLPPIGKDQKNVQQNFMFRGHDDVLNALNPLLAKHGVFVLPHVLARETSQRTTAKGSAMFEVSLLVEYTFHGACGDSVRGSAWGEGTDMGDKATSKAMTMAFKSVLNQAFAISNKEVSDPDAQTPEETTKPKAAAKPAVADPDKDALVALVKKKGGDYEKTAASYDTAKAEGRLAVWYQGALDWWQAQPDSYANKIPDKAKDAA